ncbi:MAG: hypothetical protein ACFNO5_06660, partial [Porphyromonas pasteri]
FTGMLEENGRVAKGTIDYRGKDLTTLRSNKDWEPIRGAKIATIFQDPMTSLDPINTIGSQITEVIIKHQGKSAKVAKKMAIDYDAAYYYAEQAAHLGCPEAVELIIHLLEENLASGDHTELLRYWRRQLRPTH